MVSDYGFFAWVFACQRESFTTVKPSILNRIVDRRSLQDGAGKDCKDSRKWGRLFFVSGKEVAL